jgi:outer membrane protein assembly factor BamB
MGAFSPAPATAQFVTGELIPETTALRHGLHRRWVSQVHMDLAVDRLTHFTLDRDVLCVQTQNGLTQVIEAENGGSRWVAQIGRVGYPSSELAADETHVAATNGASLYVLNLATGRPVFQKKLESAPFAAPLLHQNRVYIPLLNGMITSYSIDNPLADPQRFQSAGRVTANAIVTPKSIAWGTIRGYAYVCDPGKTSIRFQVETKGEIVAPLAYGNGVIFIASRDGYAYAHSEETGQMIWRFSAGSPLAHEPVVVQDTVYLFPEEGSMFAVSADRGTERWRRPGIKQFLALRRADPLYPEIAPALYVADTAGRVLTLDPESGALIDKLSTESLTLKMTNTLNDRLYLATPTGMIQCLHHPEIDEPLWHLPPGEAETKPAPRRSRPPVAATEGAEEEMPADDMPADEGAPEEGAPAEEESPSADPFDEPAG